MSLPSCLTEPCTCSFLFPLSLSPASHGEATLHRCTSRDLQAFAQTTTQGSGSISQHLTLSQLSEPFARDPCLAGDDEPPAALLPHGFRKAASTRSSSVVERHVMSTAVDTVKLHPSQSPGIHIGIVLPLTECQKEDTAADPNPPALFLPAHPGKLLSPQKSNPPARPAASVAKLRHRARRRFEPRRLRASDVVFYRALCE